MHQAGGLVVVLFLAIFTYNLGTATAQDDSCPAKSSSCFLPQETDLFLIGKTGHGKSTTGNSILGRNAFDVSDDTESETFTVQVGWTRRKGRTIKVVDTPGLAETRLDGANATEKFVQDMYEGIFQSPGGFHALILVLRYGIRFTKEEQQAIESLKFAFGKDFVEKFVIIVFTYGEDYYKKNQQKPFIDWCRERKGGLKSLLKECNYRVVLFNDFGDEKVESQIDELLVLVDGLSSRGKRYTNEIFEKLAAEREKMIVKERADYLRDSIQSKIDILLQGLISVRYTDKLDDATEKTMNLVLSDARDLEEEINALDKGTGVYKTLKDNVRNIQDSVKDHKHRLQNEETKKELGYLKEKYDKEIKRLEEIAGKRRGWQKMIDYAVDTLKSLIGMN